VTRRKRFRVEPASEQDIREIHTLVFENPEKHIRRLEIDKVEQLVDEGLFWVIRDVRQRRIVGVCYVKVPYTEAGKPPDPAEYGGAFVDRGYRRRGFGEVLAKVAIAHYFWDNDPDSPEPLPLVAHVHTNNPKPRTILSNLGFEFDKNVVVPDEASGFEHMPKDEDGMVRGDEFKFKPDERSSLYRTVARLLNDLEIQAEDGSISEIEFIVGPGLSSEALLELAEQLESNG
jgi:RimJ/RimL family protein N-acetyltransferase